MNRDIVAVVEITKKQETDELPIRLNNSNNKLIMVFNHLTIYIETLSTAPENFLILIKNPGILTLIIDSDTIMILINKSIILTSIIISETIISVNK